MNILDKTYKGKSGVYKIFNIINGKCYIGSTIDLNRRSKEHKTSLKRNKSQCVALQKAVNKYNLENFKIEVIKLIDDVSLVREFEEFYINFFDSVKNGYNCSNEVVKNNYLGLSCAKPILCYDLKGNFIREYNSAEEAMRILKITAVRQNLLGDIQKCNQFIFKFKINDDYSLTIPPYSKKIKSRRKNLTFYNQIKINQLDKEGNFINTFDSISKAALFLGGESKRGAINAACKEKHRTAYNFKWEYA